MTLAELMSSRWRGQPGRLEVWYSTLTDRASGTGAWLHHEFIAPTGAEHPYLHGWLAVFPPAAPPVLARFGPVPWTLPDQSGPGRAAGSASAPKAAADFIAPQVTASPYRLTGRTAEASWDLHVVPTGPPLYPFPRWSWRRELLPTTQIVPIPCGRFSGSIRYAQSILDLTDAPGATAHIYGEGNAKAWGWLHADLGGGDVLEAVAAVSTRPGLRRLPPLTFLRLRVAGQDWPALDPLLASALLRARLGRCEWSIAGRLGLRRIHVEVALPPGETVSIGYTDPDGTTATCHNSERADARIRLERREGGRWRVQRTWHLSGTAHAEIGDRD